MLGHKSSGGVAFENPSYLREVNMDHIQASYGVSNSGYVQIHTMPCASFGVFIAQNALEGHIPGNSHMSVHMFLISACCLFITPTLQEVQK
jgi:hypothetical protein